MTLRYKLFGIPGNLEELLESEKTSVTIRVCEASCDTTYYLTIRCESDKTGKEITLGSYSRKYPRHSSRESIIKRFKESVRVDITGVINNSVKKIQEKGIRVGYEGLEELGLNEAYFSRRRPVEQQKSEEPEEVIDPWKADINEMERLACGGYRR